MNRTAYFLTGAGLGGGLMFLLDPDRGRHRRAYVRDKTTAAWHDAGDTVRKTTRDVGNRIQGAAASTRSLFRGENDPGRLLARLRSRIGHVISNPRDIRMAVENGMVVLSGPVLARELDRLLQAVRSAPGVRDIDNRLDVRETVESIREFAREHRPSRTWRAVAGATGGALAIYGLSHRRETLGRAASAAGFGLLAQGATGGLRSLLRVARIAA